MKLCKEALNLYLVTDRTWLGNRKLVEDVEVALKNGVTFLQLREKELNEKDFLKLAIKLKALASRYKVPYVINDSIDIAIASDADGVHIGQGDMNIQEAREKIGPEKLLGVSVRNVRQAKHAENIGADYLGVGAVFPTSTKSDAVDVDWQTLKEICTAVSLPVVAIGGINEENIDQLKGSGINGVAVISAILSSQEIHQATKRLSDKSSSLFRK